MTDQQARKSEADAAMLSASPPAPSVPDVVREWEDRRAATRKYDGSREAQTNEIGDRMAVALTAQAKTIEVFEKYTVPISVDGKSVFIDGPGDQAIDWGDERLKRAETAEATVTELRAEIERRRLLANEDHETIAAQAAEVERLTRLLDGRDDFIVTHQLWGEFVAALPSPPITIIKGEG